MHDKINKTDKIAFPDAQTWAAFFERWHGKIVNGLSGEYCKADREDAVVQAFVKLMGKSEKDYGGRVPQTEWDWFGNIRWQAKSFLSRISDSRDTWEKYHRQATEEGYLTSSVPGFNGLDIAIRNAALRRTLDELCEEAGMKKENVAAYISRYLEGEPSAQVAAAYNMTENNLYQIRLRIERLLNSKGKDRFYAIRRRLFIEAA